MSTLSFCEVLYENPPAAEQLSRIYDAVHAIDHKNNVNHWKRAQYNLPVNDHYRLWLLIKQSEASKNQCSSGKLFKNDAPDYQLTGNIAGYCLVSAVLDEAEILNFVIDAAVQKKGWGSKLLQHVMQSLQAQGIHRLYLEVRQNNLPAVRLYSRCGFTEISTRKNYYRRIKSDADAGTTAEASQSTAVIMCASLNDKQ